MTANDIQTQNFSNDATSAIIGFDYQKLVALEFCLNSTPDDIIYIECFGDIATDDASIETKHHASKYNMTNQSPDFWKTLKNYVKERGKTLQFTRLILYTTGTISEDSIFNDWNSQSAEEKYKRIAGIRKNPNKGIQVFIDEIFNFNTTYTKEDLITILLRLEIHPSQKTIIEKYSELKDHPKFFQIEEKYRGDVIKYLYGIVSLKPVESPNQWQIVIADFFRDLRFKLNLYTQIEIPFPDLPSDIEPYTGNESFLFIEELRSIELDDGEIEKAFIDFIRSEKSSQKLLEWGAHSVQESIDIFENELSEKMSDNKNIHARSILKHELETKKGIIKSQILFFDCKKFDKLRIRGVQEIQKYFQHGKMHKIVNEKKFVWRFFTKVAK